LCVSRRPAPARASPPRASPPRALTAAGARARRARPSPQASSSTDDRGAKVAAYNTAVDAWTKVTPTGGALFSTNVYTLTINTATSGQLPSTTAPIETPALEASSELKTYPSRFAYQGAISLSTAGAAWDVAQPFTLTVAGAGVSGTATFSDKVGSTTVTRPCSSSDNSLSSCTSKCSGGTLSGYTSSNPSAATCTTYRVLSAICIVVNPAATASPIQNEAAPGCAAASGSYPGGVSPFAYTTTATQPALSTLSVPVRVKSSADPWVTAMRITSGSMSFGLTVAQKQAIGGALLGVGVVWTVLVCGGVYVLVRHCAHRKTRNTAMMATSAGGGVVIMQGAGGAPGTYYETPVGQQAYYGQPGPPQQVVVIQGGGAAVPHQYPALQAPQMGYPPQQQMVGGYPPQQMGYPVIAQPGQAMPMPGGAPHGWTPGGQQPGYPQAYPQQGYPQQYPPQQGYPQQGYPQYGQPKTM